MKQPRKIADMTFELPGYEIKEDVIEFTDYSFPPSKLTENGQVASADILDINLLGTPPEVRVGGELLFIPTLLRDELANFAYANNIKIVRRYDVWADILRPSVDNSLEDDEKAEITDRLRSVGLDDQLVLELQSRLGPAVQLFGFLSGHWEHQGRGLFAMLEATNPSTFPIPLGRTASMLSTLIGAPNKPLFTEEEFEIIYNDAMRIALVGSVKEQELEEVSEKAPWADVTALDGTVTRYFRTVKRRIPRNKS